MLYNTALVTNAHYFICFVLCLGCNGDLDKLVIVKLPSIGRSCESVSS